MKTTACDRQTPTFPLTHLPTCLLALALIVLPARAADDLSATLQRGLFEEEANHDLPAAIKAYESVVTATDAQRKLAGTALFRLAECYRKLGRTNDAVAQYQRVLREYPDQTKLVELSRQYVVASAPAELGNALEPERIRILEHELEMARGDFSQVAEMHRSLTNLSRIELRKVIPTVSPDTLLNTLQEQRVKAEQRLVELTNNFAANHPDVRSAQALLAKIELQIDDRIDGIIAGLAVSAAGRKEVTDKMAKALDEARAGASGPAHSATAPPRRNEAAIAEQRRLLQDELRVTERLLDDVRQKVMVGKLPPLSTARNEREVVHVKRELAALDEPLGGPKQRALLLDEIQLAEKGVAEAGKRVDAGVARDSENLEAQRSLSALRRELVKYDAAAQESVAAVSSERPAAVKEQAPTDEEDKEVRRIQALIKDSPDLINDGGQGGSTPLHSAASKGQLVVARFLLANKANANARRSGSLTPLHEAVMNGHKSMAELLLASGAEVNAGGAQEGTPLHCAAGRGYKSIVELLLANKADPNALNHNNATPLHAAVGKGFKSVVEVLLDAGADVNVISRIIEPNPGQYAHNVGTPLHRAIYDGNKPLIELLLARKPDVNLRNQFGETPLHLVGNNVESAALLMAAKADVNASVPAQGNDSGKTPLCFAVLNGQAEMVEFLLKNGADPNVRFTDIRSSNDPTPLTMALVLERLNNRERIVAMLLESKANPNVRDGRGYSALQISLFSMFNGSTNLPNLLLKHGADVDARDPQGNTALTWQSTGREIKELLLNYKANPNFQNEEGNTPLHNLVQRTFDQNAPSQKETAELLIARGADVNLRNRQGLTPLNLYGVPARPSRPVAIELADILRKHGAKDEQLDLEPDPESIRVWRKGMPSGRVVFVRDAAGHNRFTLMEAILNFYSLRYIPPTLAPRPVAETRVPAGRPLRQVGFGSPVPPGQPGQPLPIPPPGVMAYGAVPQSNYDPLSEIPFPDLTRIRILRAVDAAKNEKKIISVNLINAAGIVLCKNDTVLEFGDVIEIPEREYRLDEGRVGLAGDQNKQFVDCLLRRVQFVVKGEPTDVKLLPVTTMAYLASAMKQSPVRNVLRSSSDLSRLHIRRQADVALGQAAGDLTMDLEAFQRSGKLQWDDLWLRDGDVIEVPEREP